MVTMLRFLVDVLDVKLFVVQCRHDLEWTGGLSPFICSLQGVLLPILRFTYSTLPTSSFINGQSPFRRTSGNKHLISQSQCLYA